ncbi:MAG: SEC-C metal-binding domain-containing protein [Acidimicrobiales bacterium]
MLTIETIADQLQATGVELGSDPAHEVQSALDSSTMFVELEEGWVGCAAQLDGTAWSTAVSEQDVEIQALQVEPDLQLLGWWALDVAPASGIGDEMITSEELDDGTSVLAGPDGWLNGYANRTIAVGIHDGRVTIDPLDAPLAPTEALRQAIVETFEQRATHHAVCSMFEEATTYTLTSISLEDLLWETLVAHRAAFTTRPIPPVDSLLADSGFDRYGMIVGPTGTDWEVYERWRQRALLASRHNLSDDQVDAAEILIGASHAVISDTSHALGPSDDEPAAARLMAICLADTAVAKAFWGHHLARGTEPSDLVRFAERLLDRVDGTETAGVHWFIGRALDLAGDALEAEAALNRAVATGDHHPLALEAAAAFAADRGDAAGALSLLRRAGVSDENDLLVEVVGYATHRPPATAGRNDPCPCGSGRKYKHCHLGKERVALIDRAPWLYAKARRYLRDNRHRSVVMDIARTMHDASGRAGLALLDFLEFEMVSDLALCEAGIFDTFLAERHVLLPDDEALLAARWQLTERSVFEVEGVRNDSLSLRDLRNGERITVTNTNPDRRTHPGMLLLGRPLPIDDTWRAFSGFVGVSGIVLDDHLNALDAGNPFDIADLIGGSFAPPVMRNTDSQPLRFHELTYRVGDGAIATRALVAAGLRDDGNGVFIVARDSANQKNTVILTLTLDDVTLRIDANSDARATEARELIDRVLPGAQLVDHDFRDFDEATADRAGSNDPSPQPLDQSSPEVAAILEQYIEEMETRWLDESIPALGGRTPRDAAQDPIGREELRRLLVSFEGHSRGPGTMSPARLRAALGLE